MDLENLDIVNLESGADISLDGAMDDSAMEDGSASPLSLDGENSTAGIEGLITNLSLSIIAVLPTVFYALFRPKRLIPLITSEKPISRKDMTLGPGVYFLASMFSLVLMLNLADFITGGLSNEFAADGGGLTSAAAKGSLTSFAIRALPIYAAGIILSLISFGLFRFTGPEWTLRIALAGGFYSLATILIIGFIPTVLLTLFDPTGAWPFGATITSFLFLFSMMLIPLWHAYHFSRAVTKASRVKIIALCLVFGVFIDRLIAMMGAA